MYCWGEAQKYRLLSSMWMLSSNKESLGPKLTRFTPGSARKKRQSNRLILGSWGVMNRAIGSIKCSCFYQTDKRIALICYNFLLLYRFLRAAMFYNLLGAGSSKIPVSYNNSLTAVIFAKPANSPEYISSSLSQTPPGKTSEFSKDICGLRTSIRKRFSSPYASPRERMMLADNLSGLMVGRSIINSVL